MLHHSIKKGKIIKEEGKKRRRGATFKYRLLYSILWRNANIPTIK